jgi:hypothetical protein
VERRSGGAEVVVYVMLKEIGVLRVAKGFGT